MIAERFLLAAARIRASVQCIVGRAANANPVAMAARLALGSGSQQRYAINGRFSSVRQWAAQGLDSGPAT